MIKVQTYHQIDKQQWKDLIQSSPTATWFQTSEAYQFYASVNEMIPFAVGVEEASPKSSPKGKDLLKGVVVGYMTQEKNLIKQLLTCRAIIIGGPLLADDISEEALTVLLEAIRRIGERAPHEVTNSVGDPAKAKGKETSEAVKPAFTQPEGRLHPTPIYVEIRNFHDYSRWKQVFTQNGFAYQPHLNFHVDTTTTEIIEANLGKSRKRDIKTSLRDGATIVEKPTIDQVRTYYVLLKHLYMTKIKTPLFAFDFFENLYNHPNGHFVLIEKDNEIIGGTVCVELPNRCLYEWFVCGRDGEWKSIFPSSLATYAGICYAEKQHCTRFDMMGAGTPDEAYGVRDFKARFGGELVEYGRFLCIRKPLLYKIGKLGVKILKKV